MGSDNTHSKRMSTLQIAQGGMIAALYIVLTFAFAPISFGPVQVRIAEILTILPMFTPSAIYGLFIGCLVGNIVGGAVIWDIIFGSLATLIGAGLGYLLRKNRWLVPIPSILSNAIIVPLILRYGYSIKDIPLHFMVIYIAVGEFISCYVLGEILASALLRHGKALF